MTDTVDEIVVTGQRRRPGGSFPMISKGNPSGDNPDEYPENPDGGTPDPYFNPCEDPVQRYEWDMDAAAARGKAKLVVKRTEMGDTNFNVREYGAWLYRTADGRIEAGPAHVGSLFSNGGNGQVPIPFGDIDPATIVGSVHSHSVGNHLPSPTGPDGAGDIAHLNSISDLGAGAGARVYIVAQTLVNAGEEPYDRINVYSPATAQAAINNLEVGPEVNPEAQSCAL